MSWFNTSFLEYLFNFISIARTYASWNFIVMLYVILTTLVNYTLRYFYCQTVAYMSISYAGTS